MENKKLKTLVGSPINASKGGELGAGTEAAKRPMVDSSIKSNKMLGGDTGGFGVDGVDTKGMGGGYGGRRSQASR